MLLSQIHTIYPEFEVVKITAWITIKIVQEAYISLIINVRKRIQYSLNVLKLLAVALRADFRQIFMSIDL